MAYNPQNINGQAIMVNSEPVVIASDQSSIPVTGTGVFDVTPITPTALDYLPVRLTDGTAFYTASGGGSGGGSSIADKGMFVEGTTTLTVTGGVFNETTVLDPIEDQAAAARITAKRAIHVNLRNTAGAELGTAGNPVKTDTTGATVQPVSGTFFQTTQPVSLATNAPDVTDRAARLLGVVTPIAITKATQGTTGFTTQDLKDAGRNQVHYYTVIPVLSTAIDALQSLTGTKGGVTVTAVTTPAVVTAGKILRITRVATTYIATATSGYGIVRLRFNTAGVVAITSPIAATITVGAPTPATANSVGIEEASISEGWEFAAGTGIGVSVQGFAAVTATAVGYVLVSVTGYEY